MIGIVVSHRTARSILVALTATVGCIAGAPSDVWAQSDLRPTIDASDVAAVGAAFRLGDAGRPLGWSTGVADFNHDGTPDLAIADRVGHSASGYRFRLQFVVGGLPVRTVGFESEQESLAIA